MSEPTTASEAHRDDRDRQVAESDMVVGDEGDAGSAAGPALGSRSGGPSEPRGPGPVSRRRRWTRLAVVVVVVLVALAVTLLVRPQPPVEATALGGWTQLAGVPTRPVAERWSQPAPTAGSPSVIGDLVVVAEPTERSSRVANRMLRVTAREVRTGRLAWWEEVPARSAVLLVDVDGGEVDRLDTHVDGPGPVDVGVGLSVDDGRTLWRRSGGGAGVGWVTMSEWLVLSQHEGACEVFEARSGSVRWSADGRACWPADRDHVVVATDDGWQVRRVGGGVVVTVDDQESVPVVAGDLVVQARGRDLVALDHDGVVRWRAEHPWGHAWPRLVPGLGVAAVDGGGRLAVGFDLQGRPLDLPSEVLMGLQLDVGGRRLAVGSEWAGARGLRIHDVGDEGRELAATELQPAPSFRPYTRHGLLLVERGDRADDPGIGPDRSEGNPPVLGLYGYTELAPRWTVELPGDPVHVASSDAGVIVVTEGSGDTGGHVLRGYS